MPERKRGWWRRLWEKILSPFPNGNAVENRPAFSPGNHIKNHFLSHGYGSAIVTVAAQGAGKLSEVFVRRTEIGRDPPQSDAASICFTRSQIFCRGRIIHRRLRGASAASPRRRLNHSGNRIS
jgi:hypothetical protein